MSKPLPTLTKRLPCQVCGRMLTVQRDGLTKPHKRTRGSEDYCSGTGYRQARWPVGQRLRHHAGSVWVVEEDRGGENGNYLIRCPDGQKSPWRDEWIEEPGKTIVAHGEYMHRHGWTPIEEST
jgi:hypothetical protein